LQLACHAESDGFRDVYGRMRWDAPAPTITGGCINPSKGRFLHPVHDRSITLREAALLQFFPEEHPFRLEGGKYRCAEMIGDALPPAFVAQHARGLARMLAALAPKEGVSEGLAEPVGSSAAPWLSRHHNARSVRDPRIGMRLARHTSKPSGTSPPASSPGHRRRRRRGVAALLVLVGSRLTPGRWLTWSVGMWWPCAATPVQRHAEGVLPVIVRAGG